jgi:hypothetical protein
VTNGGDGDELGVRWRIARRREWKGAAVLSRCEMGGCRSNMRQRADWEEGAVGFLDIYYYVL